MTQQDEKIIVKVDEEIEDLVPGFLENRANDLKLLRNALQAKDYETIRSLGHRMKGSGGGYGFDAITDLGHGLEEASREKDPEEIQRLIRELSHFLYMNILARNPPAPHCNVTPMFAYPPSYVKMIHSMF